MKMFVLKSTYLVYTFINCVNMHKKGIICASIHNQDIWRSRVDQNNTLPNLHWLDYYINLNLQI